MSEIDSAIKLDAMRRLMNALEKVDVVPVVRCKDCRWGKEACGNIECTVDSINMWVEYHGYEWFCPNGERRESDDRER